MQRLAILFLLLGTPALATGQQAELRQQRIYAGDIAELVIVHDAGIPSMYAIDTAPLLADFEVLGTDARMLRIKQDDQSIHRMVWRAQLVPRRTGRIEIPSLQYGEYRSAPLLLTVDTVPPGLESGQKVFVEIEAQPANPYPGQQTRIQYRLFHNLPLSGGSLHEPEPTQAQVFRSGRERNYREQRNGETFDVLERAILVIPLSTTQLDIEPAHISTSLPGATQAGFDLAGNRRFVHRKSQALQLSLREMPPGIETRDWLPAQDLQMSLQQAPRDRPLEPGDTIDLLLELRARGLTADALPADLLLRDSDHFTVYAEPPTRRSRVAGPPGDEYLVGELRQRFTLLFERAGETRLPALQVDWWDTTRDRARVAELPAIPLTVIAPGIDSRAELADVYGGVVARREPLSRFTVDPLQAVITMLLLALGGLLAGPLFRRVRALREAGEHWQAQWRARRALLRACRANDPQAARDRLLHWSRLRWSHGDVIGLRQLAAIPVTRDWKRALAQLDEALYAEQAKPWQGRALEQLVRQQEYPGRAAVPASWPNLYPSISSRRLPATSPEQV